MSIRLLILCVGQVGPATMGRNVRSVGLRIRMYSLFCAVIAFCISIDLCNFGNP